MKTERNRSGTFGEFKGLFMNYVEKISSMFSVKQDFYLSHLLVSLKTQNQASLLLQMHENCLFVCLLVLDTKNQHRKKSDDCGSDFDLSR